MNVSFLQELLSSVAEQGRALLPKSLFGADAGDDVEELARALMSGRGEASGVAIARELLDRYSAPRSEERLRFFNFLADEMRPDAARRFRGGAGHLDEPLRHRLPGCRRRWKARASNSSAASTWRRAQRRDRRHAPRPAARAARSGARRRRRRPAHASADVWFNRGFLVLRRIDWQTPAAILEKIIAYEAVHEIQGWDDLRRRLDPTDRRCFAFFHPSLIDEPLIFVEVALMRDIPDAIATVLDGGATTRRPASRRRPCSIRSPTARRACKGISFGNFLFKQVVEELVRERRASRPSSRCRRCRVLPRWLDRSARSGGRRSRQPLNSARCWPGCAIRAGSRSRRKMVPEPKI